MRILVTPQGTQFVSEIEEMSNTVQSRFTNAIGTSRNFSTSHYKPHFTNTFKTHRNRFKSSSNTNTSFYKTKSRSNSKPEASTEYIDTEKTTFTRGELKQAKHINLKMTKISFPKNFVEKYEKDSKPSNKIITTSGTFLPTLTNNNLNTEEEQNSMNKMYSFKEIIPEQTVTKIKHHMINESKMKAKLARVTETQFRTPYQSQTELEKFDNILDCPKVTPNKLSLIKYLNESKNLNPIALKSLVESNPERLSRVNKICQILFHEEEQQRIINDIIKGKIRQKVNSEKIDFQNTIKQMKNEVDGIKDKLNKYSKRLDDRERYRDLHNDLVVHHWGKHNNYERFNKKPLFKSPKFMSQRSFTDNNGTILPDDIV